MSLLITFILLLLLPIIFPSGQINPGDFDPDSPQFCVRSNNARADQIISLPGIINLWLGFSHFSGFLNISRGHYLHYWFVTSQHRPCEDPLNPDQESRILTNHHYSEGPGCSSLLGLLDEMGPYLVNPNGKTLRKNSNNWNKHASIVYIESPAGVGYSHSSNAKSELPNDESTAEGNYEAIKHFFAKFPLFRRNPVFITGESYGGIYVPTLVAKILDGQAEFPINLEGMAIGNGYLSTPLDTDTLVRFAYARGLVSEKVWGQIERECCGGCAENCNLGTQKGACGENVFIANIFDFCWNGGLNVYDIYRNCDPHPKRSSKIMTAIQKGIFRTKAMYANETKLWKKLIKMQGNGTSSKSKLHHELRCLDDSAIVNYLRSSKVREALHIPASVPAWDVCSDWVSTIYQTQYAEMSPFVMKALKAKVRVLLYYGDTDMACNFLLGQKFADRLGLAVREDKKAWYYERQIAGFKTVYERGLTYITVRGAGHMVPKWRPAQIEQAMRNFLLNRPI